MRMSRIGQIDRIEIMSGVMGTAKVRGPIAVIIAVMAFPEIALAQPVPPQVFVGSVTQGIAPALEGAEVTAWIDGTQVGAGTVTNGQYKVLVAQPQDQSFTDKTVTFQVGGQDVPEIAIWQVVGATELNLSALATEQPTVNTQPTHSEPIPASTDTPPQPELISEPVQPETPVAGTDENKRRRAFVGVVDGKPGATVDVVRNGTNQRVTIRLEDYKL